MEIINNSSLPPQVISYLEKFKENLLSKHEYVPSKKELLFDKKEKIPAINSEQLMLGLLANYSAEVERNGAQFLLNDGIVSLFSQLANWFLNLSNRGMLLLGRKLSGKKTICESLYRFIRPFHFWPGSIQVISATEWHDRFKARDKDASGSAYNDIVQSKVLFLTDLGDEPEKCMIYGEIQKPIYHLLSIRQKKHLVTIITTSLTPREFLKRYDKGVVGLFSLEFVSFSTPDEEFVDVPKLPSELPSKSNSARQISSTKKYL